MVVILNHPMTYEETVMFRYVFSAAMIVWIPYFIWIFGWNLNKPNSKNDMKILACVGALSVLFFAGAFILHSKGVI